MDNKFNDEFGKNSKISDAWAEQRAKERKIRQEYIHEMRERRMSREHLELENKLNQTEKPKKIKNKTPMFSKVLSLILCLFLGIGGGYFGSYLYNANAGSQNNLTVATPIEILPEADDGVVAAVAAKALPSVVGITTTAVINTFFGPQEAKSVGSGIIVDKRGYILTNSHVVGDGKAKDIQVLLADDSTVSATLLWNDDYMDLAVIKVIAPNLIAAEMGNSDELKIGEKAIAIGNPLGLEFNRSVTAGYISGVGRSLQTMDGKTISNLIQTDAAINQGNSGGPLLNSKGEVIGINSAKIGGEGTEGLGFAIPINTAKEIVLALIERGDKKPLVLGVELADYQYYKAYFQIKDELDSGAIVLKVAPDSIAEKIGLEQKDIITQLNDDKIKNAASLRNALIKMKEGDTATIHFYRNDQEKTIQFTF